MPMHMHIQQFVPEVAYVALDGDAVFKHSRKLQRNLTRILYEEEILQVHLDMEKINKIDGAAFCAFLTVVAKAAALHKSIIVFHPGKELQVLFEKAGLSDEITIVK